jgi:site-specific DNA-methyltransferase (adenine-specific)
VRSDAVTDALRSPRSAPVAAAEVKPYFDHCGITIYHGDCREIFPRLHDVALIVTDPPYFWRDRHRSSLEWFRILEDDELELVLADARRLLPTDGVLYVFTDVRTGIRLFPALDPANILVWDKGRIGEGEAWRRMYEWIAYCPGPAHRLRDGGLGNIIRCAPPRQKQHPTEKPVAVVSALIENSSDPGDLVLDPFMGSGSTLLAAQSLGRRAIGIEIEERYCEIAAARLARGIATRNLTPQHLCGSSSAAVLRTPRVGGVTS